MEILLIVIAIIALTLVGVWAYQRSKKKNPKTVKPLGRDPLKEVHEDLNGLNKIKPGDVITMQGENHFVRGSIFFNEDGYTWQEHFIDNTKGTKSWISVENDPEAKEEISVALWETVETEVNVGDKQIVFQGVTYHRDERGRANYQAHGTTGVVPQGTVNYVDYEGDDGTLLGFESFNGSKWEASLGKPILAGNINVYPALEEEN